MDHLRGGSAANGPSFPPPVATSSGLATIAVNPTAAIVGNSGSGTTEYKMISQSAPSSPTANVTLPDGQKIIGRLFFDAPSHLYEGVSVRRPVGPFRVIFRRVLGASCAVYPASFFE